jgi:hypothetical protein
MARLSLCALLAVLVACDGQKLRMVPCNEAADCEANQLCLAKRCEPCGELCQPSETPDAGEKEDAGIDEPDAGMEIDAGVEEIDAGMEEVDAGDWDAGLPEPDGGVLSNIDPACDDPDAGVVFPPTVALPQTVPTDCLVGFELNNYQNAVWSISSVQPSGSRALKLEVDLATYKAADTIRMQAVVNGTSHDLFATCRLKTADYGDPTRGLSRPPVDAIREFRVDLPLGTTQLTFDFTGTSTPSYLRVLGLCDFDLSNPPSIGRKWRLVTSR